jgi:hypothetical protein
MLPSPHGCLGALDSRANSKASQKTVAIASLDCTQSAMIVKNRLEINNLRGVKTYLVVTKKLSKIDLWSEKQAAGQDSMLFFEHAIVIKAWA